MMRIDKINYYLNIAESVCMRSTCLRKQYGCVVVKSDEIIATGYSGAPRGRTNCIDIKNCLRKQLDIPSGQRYELCRSVHAEMNAIISAARAELLGSDIYLTGIDLENPTRKYVEGAESCLLCKKNIINAGVNRVFIRRTQDYYECYDVNDWDVTNITLEK